MSADRLPPLPDAELTPEQAAARQKLLAGARGVFQGPFIPLLRNPALLGRVEKLGAYLRYESTLPGRIREFAILAVARAYSQQVEWAIHQPLALQEGVRPLVVAAIAEGRRPELMPEDEAVTWDFLAELEAHRSVSDATYARARAPVRRGRHARSSRHRRLLRPARPGHEHRPHGGAGRGEAAAVAVR